jgi:hypothetical protein
MESQKQRLERIAVQCMVGIRGNPEIKLTDSQAAVLAISRAKALIKQIDALPPLD